MFNGNLQVFRIQKNPCLQIVSHKFSYLRNCDQIFAPQSLWSSNKYFIDRITKKNFWVDDHKEKNQKITFLLLDFIKIVSLHKLLKYTYNYSSLLSFLDLFFWKGSRLQIGAPYRSIFTSHLFSSKVKVQKQWLPKKANLKFVSAKSIRSKFSLQS